MNYSEKTIGRISAIRKNTYYIIFEGDEIRAKLKGSFGRNGNEELPVVGDYVEFIHNPMGDSVISAIQPRKSIMKRPDQSGHAIGYVKTMKEQAMAANFDYVFIVTSLNDDYNKNRVARYVSHTLETDAIPVVILTKADLCDDVENYVSEIAALSEKVRVHAVSALKGIGMEQLKEYFVPGKTIILLGSSGAGKSTLVNAIAGKEVMKTSEIRESDSKGRHTTTYRQLLELEGGVTIIDTPGMREIGLMSVENGINDTFIDIEEIAENCRFSDCRHNGEPGCAVKAAIESGELDPERFALYKSLKRENNANEEMKRRIILGKSKRG